MRKSTEFLLITLLVVCLLALAGLGVIAARAKSPTSVQTEVAHGVTHVIMKEDSFQPAAIEVAVGTTVVWTNGDSAYHTVNIGNAMVSSVPSASGQIAPGRSFSYTFLTRGTYSYYCADDPDSMRGTVIVN